MLRLLTQYLLFPTLLALGTGTMIFGINHELNLELLAAIIALITIVTVYLAERILPFRQEWNLGKQDFKTDITSLAVILGVLEPFVKVATVWLSSIVLILMGDAYSLSLFPNDWPLLIQLALFALGTEFGRYWIHRWSHSNVYLWRFHAAHHSAERLYQFNGYRIHPINFLWNYFLGQFPLVLLGSSEQIILLYFVFSSITAAFQHSNIDSKNGLLNLIFSTNELHRWHHTTDSSVGYKNHGSVLIVWDIVFGSYYSDKSAYKEGKVLNEVGLSSPKHYPINSYIRQLAAPFCWKRCVTKEN